MSKSIYGGGGGGISVISTQPIYGNIGPTQCCTVVQPSIPPIAILQQIAAMVEAMKSAIEKFYPATSAIAQLVADMNVRVFVPFVVGVRLAWIKRYAKQTILNEQGETVEVTQTFDNYSEVHRLQLKDLYLAAGRDWRTDPMFIALGLV